MQRRDAFTRAELVAATGLSAPTVGSLLSELTERGLVRDLGPGPSSGGRRPSFMEFDARYGFVAGIDLGPATTRLAVADLWGERTALRVLPTPTAFAPRSCSNARPRLCGARARSARAARAPARRRRRGAGRRRPAEGRGDARPEPCRAGRGSRCAASCEDALETPVAVENDVNLAVLGERWKGAARGHDTCVFINLDAGIGAGVVVNGALHRGPPFARRRDRPHVHGAAVPRARLRQPWLPRDARRPERARRALAGRQRQRPRSLAARPSSRRQNGDGARPDRPSWRRRGSWASPRRTSASSSILR